MFKFTCMGLAGVVSIVASCADGMLPKRAANDPTNPQAHETRYSATSPSSPSPPPAASTKAPALYTCPMHPEILSKTPGKCPICGMTLVPKTAASATP